MRGRFRRHCTAAIICRLVVGHVAFAQPAPRGVEQFKKGSSRRFVIVLLFLSLTLGFASAQAKDCRDWKDVLLNSFLPKEVDTSFLRQVSQLSNESYFAEIAKIEASTIQSVRSQSLPEEQRLRGVLGRFYSVGANLYGVNLDPEKFAIIPDMNVNAFATGNWVVFNQGLSNYFLNPTQYLMDIGAFPKSGYSRQDLVYLRSQFSWRDDWDSIYFVLAHEAAHNLMRHSHEHVWTAIHDLENEYKKAVSDQRKDVAQGRAGGGVRRYLLRSLTNFLSTLGASDHSRRMESEADMVATLLLQRAGFNPVIARTAGIRMSMLTGPQQVRGWQNVMTEALCSTHPDWIVRVQEIDRSLSCVQGRSRLCEEHVTYPVEQELIWLRNSLAQLEGYEIETATISQQVVDLSTLGSNVRSMSQGHEVEIKVEPKDSRLVINGQVMQPGKIRLPIGRYSIRVSQDGFEEAEQTLVVFSDVRPKVEIKLKRTTRR